MSDATSLGHEVATKVTCTSFSTSNSTSLGPRIDGVTCFSIRWPRLHRDNVCRWRGYHARGKWGRRCHHVCGIRLYCGGLRRGKCCDGIRVHTKAIRLMTSECQSVFLGMRQRGTSVRYISQHLYSQHSLQWPAVCYLVHGRHFRVRGRSFGEQQYP
jgi:hypothetical protein